MRIAIVEDEPRIREGLAKLIKKIDPGYEIVGEAQDGIEGLRIICETGPDLVITDVRMPELDGLEMLKRLEERSVRVKAIILSAYSEFSYACQAMKLGVGEYLLKPIKVGDLTRALREIESQIASEEKLALREGALSLEGALYSIALGGVAVDAGLRSFLGRSYGVETEGCFALADIYLGSEYETASPRMLKRAASALAKASGFDYALLEHPLGARLLVIAFNVVDLDAARAWFDTYLTARLREVGPKELCVGWGCFRDLSGLRETMRQVDACLDWSIVVGGDAMIAWPEVEARPVAAIPYPSEIEGGVRSALSTLDRGGYESGILEFLRYLRANGSYSPKEIKNALIRFFWSVLSAAREVEYERYAALAQQEILEAITFAVTWPELEAAAAALLRLFPENPELSPGGGSIVRRAMNLVSEFYSQGITLNEVAVKVNVTSEYLSAQFHRETGMTFSAYIRDFRVQKAKKLLMGTDLRLYAIGEQVGYRDAKYFCRVFKEVTGQKPSDYRKANR